MYCEAKPALLRFEDDQRLISGLREENTELKKKVRWISMSFIVCFPVI